MDIMENDWIYTKYENDEIRKCPKCKLSEIKNAEGHWVTLLTSERIGKYFKNIIAGREETCPHQNWIEN